MLTHRPSDPVRLFDDVARMNPAPESDGRSGRTPALRSTIALGLQLRS
jgi:hypothetical protein